MDRMEGKLDFLVERFRELPVGGPDNRREAGVRGGESPLERNPPPGLAFQGKTIRLQFPTFDGETGEVVDWLYTVEQVFRYHETPRNQWVSITSMHLKGDALGWYRWFEGMQEEWVSWGVFTKAILKKFGPSEYEDFAGSLMRLKQIGSLKEYDKQFERLSSRVSGLSEELLLSCYIGGLKDEIRLDVKVLGPWSVSSAMGVARLLEEKLNLQRKGFKWGGSKLGQEAAAGKGTFGPAPGKELGEKGTSQLPTIKRLSAAEMKEGRDKGLCYHCEEKFHPGHKCKNPKLFCDGRGVAKG